MYQDAHIAFLELRNYFGLGRRGARVFAYFLVSGSLLSLNTYGIEHSLQLAITIGILGAFSRSALIGQTCIAILALMAVIPVGAIRIVAGIFMG